MVLNQTTLGELYQSLSLEEVKGLDLYLQKNTVGKENILYQLHKLMAEAKLQAMLAKLDTNYIKAELFGGDEKSVSKLTTYNNLLINHIKDYLILSKVKEKNIYTEALWGEILIERGLKRNLLLKLTNYKFDLYNDMYSLMKNFLHKRELFFFEHLHLSKKNYSSMVDRLKSLINAFKDYTDIYNIELYNGYLSLSRQINLQVELPVEKINELIYINTHSENNLLIIQSLSLELATAQTKDSYLRLREFFISNLGLFSLETCTQIIPILLNFGQVRVNKGSEDFDWENYIIFKTIDNSKFLYKQGIFTIVRLFNFIRLELRFGTIEKAEQLLAESLKVISPAQKDSFQYLIESRISFAKKDYKLSLRKISIINPSDSIYYFPQYKIMLIKNYIMLADIDRLMAERENFYKYINHQKNIQEDEKRRHKLFIKYTEYLTNARYEYLTDYMKKRIENALLQTSPYFSEKQWVRERWEELKGN
jgi:hypothetical protein